MKQINRRDFLELMAIAGAGARLSQAALSQGAKRTPNIVFIFADDLGLRQIGCYGNDYYETPHIDSLAEQGMRFTDAYAAAPVCSPTRASLMTGKYPARVHITDYIPGNPYPYNKLETPDMAKGLALEEVTIPEMLSRAGYVSGHFGKWHLNKDKEYSPGRPGDPGSQGFEDVLTTHKPRSEEATKASNDPDYDAHHVQEITDRSIAFMRKNKDRPFFCYITHNTIHRPLMAYGPVVDKYAKKLETDDRMGNNPILGAMMEDLDDSVGRVLKEIEDLGIADNTMVIFFGDNGCYYGREGRAPLYGAKGDLYEGGVRVPCLIRWPGIVAPGTTCSEPVSTIDFFPTFAEIAGVKTEDPAIDGVSISSLLKGSDSLNRDTLYWHYPHYHSHGIAPSGAIREENYKLIEWFEKSLLGSPKAEGALELFDLSKDPGESRNLAREEPERAMRMYRKLKSRRESVGVQQMIPNPDFDPEKEGAGR